jgi:tRNA A-37 threonylcarbamoyl transferase component Bud32
MAMALSEPIVLRLPAATIWGDPAVPQALLCQIARAPDELLKGGASRPLKIERVSLVLEADLALGERQVPVVIKQYRPRTLGKAVAAIVRPAKAMQNWRKAVFLRSHDIATPPPLLACRPRGAASVTSFLVTKRIAGAENLHLFAWRFAAEPARGRLRLAADYAAALGRLIGRMHAAGAAHRDLKAANFLVIPGDCESAVCLIDLDGLQPGSRICFQRQARDLARLAAGLVAHPWITPAVCRRFLREYLVQFSGDAADWKLLWRAIATETAAYVRRKEKCGQRVL